MIVQDDNFDATNSITICAFTTDPIDAPLFLVVEPNERNGLRSRYRLMVDKITTVPKAKMGARVGRLDDEDMVRLNQAMTVFLGMAISPRTGRRNKEREHWTIDLAGRETAATGDERVVLDTEGPGDDGRMSSMHAHCRPNRRRRVGTGALPNDLYDYAKPSTSCAP